MNINEAMSGEWQNFPEGHYGKLDARRIIDLEYEESRNIERKWYAKFRTFPKINNADEALFIINNLAYKLGEKRPIIRKIVLCSPDISGVAGAHYCARQIHFRTSYIAFGTLLHEGAHYWRHSHDSQFCEILDLLFEAAYEDSRH